MDSIGIVCPDEKDRSKLLLAAGEAGYGAHAAFRLQEAVEILRERHPRLMLVADGPDCDAELVVREILRVSPLMPVIAALKVRDANRAVCLMRVGAVEVVAPPWTRENLQACMTKTLRYQGTAFSVVRTPVKRRTAHFFFLVVAAYFALAFSQVALKRQAALRQEAALKRYSWDMPYGHPAGLSFDGKDLWSIDWFSQSLYVHSTEDLSIKRLVHFPAEVPVALSLSADSVWSASANGTILRHMKDDRLTVTQRYKQAAPQTLGIVFDGLYLWTCDARRLYKRIVDDQLTVLESYPYPGGKPAALAFDGKSIWSLDSANNQLLRHNLESPEQIIRRIPLSEYRDGKYKPMGMTWDGKRFWTVAEKRPKDSGPARMFEHQVLNIDD